MVNKPQPNPESAESTKVPFDREKFLRELREFRGSMRMGKSVIRKMRSEARY